MKKHTPLGVEEGFFAAPRQSSRVKQRIIAAYFDAYMNVMARDQFAGYADLFAGPGIYGNNEKSVPILICEKVVSDERLRRFAKLWFNEGDPIQHDQLERNIGAVRGISTLKHRPAVTCRVITEEWAPKLAKLKTPTLVFADPCGYKGLSLRLMSAALKGFGNDVLFFFNYNRINMKLGYPVMDDSINEFFERDRAEALRLEIASLDPPKREEAVLAAVKQALAEANAMTLTFRFRTREGGGTSHHLVFASKSKKGIGIMKRLMSAASSDISDGVGSHELDPRDANRPLPLFSGLEEVRQRLLSTFSGRNTTFEQLISSEARLTRFTDTNYRDALLELEAEDRITVNPPAENRRFQAGGIKRTLPGRTLLTFPK